MEDDGFTLVKRKKRRNAAQQQNARENKKKRIFDTAFLEICDKDEMLQKLEKSCELLNKIGIFSETFNFIKNPDKIENIICFGLGNFASCSAALYQLAWLNLVIEKLDFHKKFEISQKIYFYDPIFTEFEKNFIKNELKYSLLTENTECKHTINSETLFYMPRLYKTHYNNVLSSNYDNLDQIQIFSTSFNIMFQDIDHNEQPILAKLNSGKSDYEIIEKRIPDYEELFNIFTYQSLHSFQRKQKL